MKNQLTAVFLATLLTGCGAQTDAPANPFQPVSVTESAEPIVTENAEPTATPIAQETVVPDPVPVPMPIVAAEPLPQPVQPMPVQTSVSQMQVESETQVDVVETPVSDQPEIINPENNRVVVLEMFQTDSNFLVNSTMICDLLTFDQSARIFKNSVEGGSSWFHFEDGTGEKYSFFANEPVNFNWSIEDGVYVSDMSPLDLGYAEIFTHADGRELFKFWDIENPNAPHFECYFR